MRKIVILCLMAMLGFVSAKAQTFDRMIVHETTDKGFMLDRVDSVTFVYVGEDVVATPTIHDFSTTEMTISVKRSEACAKFKMMIELKSVVKQLKTPAYLASYVDRKTTNVYAQDVTNGTVRGIDLYPNTEYVLLTLGIDKYGTVCDVAQAEFKTEQIELKGDPKVEYTIEQVGQRDFTITFKPNADVFKYYVIAAETGVVEMQFAQLGIPMGLYRLEDYIKYFQDPRFENYTRTWTNQHPNTEFEVFVVLQDYYSNYANTMRFNVKTEKKGGDGEAEVEITVGDYTMEDWNGENRPTQTVNFLPNDQTCCYRFNCYPEAAYDAEREALHEKLKSEPLMPSNDWYQFDASAGQWAIEPNTKCVVIAAAKNGNGVYGEVKEVRFTTPASVQGVIRNTEPSKILEQRIVNKETQGIREGEAIYIPTHKTEPTLILSED